MKRIIFMVCVVVFLVISLILGISRAENGKVVNKGDVGRFQLFQGTYTVLDAINNKADKEIGIFLLDTSTGEVKCYMTGLLPGGTTFGSWEPTIYHRTIEGVKQ